ncbi:hypothetical protein BP5796_11453 [Coleophoma crateriformis]|uniref:Secreted protein n=1 Tax=Coleophoma crateriformis TaxID=565419 RepID=A0A3D8QIM0_9HELO|nr:hypothetical protein BP5796_11453 [Coleophoma crateriformis]
MLFNNLAGSALAICALLVPSVLGQDNLEPRTLDMEVRWFPTTNCHSGGGPPRGYSRNVCIPISTTSHGIKILESLGSCRSKNSLIVSLVMLVGLSLKTPADKIRVLVLAYDSGTCTGKAKIFDTAGCNSLAKKWSVKVVC